MRQETQTEERHPLRNAAAAVAGAAEGLKEGLQEEHLMEESQRAIHNVGELSRAAAGETRRQWQSPEMQQVRQDTSRVAGAAGERVREATAGASTAMQERTRHATEVVQEKAHTAQDRIEHTTEVVQEKAHLAQERIQHGVEEVRDTTVHLAHEGMVRAQAVGETSKRAARAPKHIKDDLKEASSSYAHSLTAGVGMFALAGVLGAAGLAVLTVGLVVWLNALLGSPWGYFLTVAGYLVVAGILAAVAIRRRKKLRDEARGHVEDARREVRHVTRPVRRAFTHLNE